MEKTRLHYLLLKHGFKRVQQRRYITVWWNKKLKVLVTRRFIRLARGQSGYTYLEDTQKVAFIFKDKETIEFGLPSSHYKLLDYIKENYNAE